MLHHPQTKTSWTSLTLFFLTLLHLCPSVAQAQRNRANPTLYLILCVDLDEQKVKAGAKYVKRHLPSKLRRIAQKCGMRFKEIMMTKALFNRSALKDTIIGLRFGSNDAVVFYFLGHGFRYRDQSNVRLDVFPQLFVSNQADDHPYDAGLHLGWVHSEIKAKLKKPRFLLSIGECCNTKIGINAPGNVPVDVAARVPFSEEEKLKQLFLYSRGHVIVSSSKPLQKSYLSRNGGIFYSNFEQVLADETTSAGARLPTWEGVLQKVSVKVKKQARSKGYVQEPQQQGAANVTYNH